MYAILAFLSAIGLSVYIKLVLPNLKFSFLSQDENDLAFWLSASDATTPSPSKQAEPPGGEQDVKVKVTVAPVLTSEEEDSAKIDTHVSLVLIGIPE